MIRIGLVGFNNNQLNILKKKFPKNKLTNIKDLNDKKYFNLNAIVAYNQSAIENFIFEKKFLLFQNLNWLHLSIAGVDEYIENFKKLKFTVTCGKIIQGSNVSEQGLALLLYLTRLNKNKNNQFNSVPITIYRKKVLIYGFGGIGINLAEKCAAFGCDVHTVSNKVKPNLSFIRKHYTDDSFINDLNKFDIIFISAPLTKYTENFFNYKLMSKMKSGSYLINVSRGKILNTDDLVKLLDKNKFAGVGLDVLDHEPIPKNHILKKYRNVLISDHTAGMGSDKNLRFDLVVKNIDNYLNNRKLNNIVDTDEEY